MFLENTFDARKIMHTNIINHKTTSMEASEALTQDALSVLFFPTFMAHC